MKFPYYKHKLDAEKVIEASGVPYTILRATQFHPLLDTFLGTLFKRGPFLILPGGMQFQLIDAGRGGRSHGGDAGERAVRPPARHRRPEVADACRRSPGTWLKATGKRLINVPVPAPAR